ncbi:hypothetical protein DAI22_02g310150 [Oryza sativa Japonica Group]|nr:hypothetical protein DAI22_02g310150 [Oryza sativa Japonica Group]
MRPIPPAAVRRAICFLLASRRRDTTTKPLPPHKKTPPGRSLQHGDALPAVGWTQRTAHAAPAPRSGSRPPPGRAIHVATRVRASDSQSPTWCGGPHLSARRAPRASTTRFLHKEGGNKGRVSPAPHPDLPPPLRSSAPAKSTNANSGASHITLRHRCCFVILFDFGELVVVDLVSPPGIDGTFLRWIKAEL